MGKGTILPIRRIDVLVGDDVMGRALCEKREARASRAAKSMVSGMSRGGSEGRCDGAHHVVLPCQLLHDIGDVAHRQRHHDMGRPRTVSRLPGFC